jgi:dephospho-CoA kinase
MDAVKVVGLVGRAGAGKDTVAGMLEEKYPSVRMGEVVIEETRRRNLELTDENVGAVASDLRRREGMDAIARRCIDRIRALEAPMVIVNGIRGPDEIRLFKRAFDGFHVIEVWSPEKVRYERIRSRGRSDDTADYDQFLARDRREESWGLGEAISLATHRIANDGSLENLRVRAEETIESIRSDC